MPSKPLKNVEPEDVTSTDDDALVEDDSEAVSEPPDESEGEGKSDLSGGDDEDDFGQDFRAEWSASGRFADRSGRERPLGDLASKLLRVGAEAVNQTTERLKEAGEDFRPRDIVSGAAAISAKGREELAGLIAKEVRLYMDKFRIGEELRALMTDMSPVMASSD